MTTSIKRLLDIIKSVGLEFTLNDVVMKVNISPRTAKKYINEMLKRGLIVDVNGRYAVTDNGLFLIEGDSIRRKKISEREAYIFTDVNGNPLAIKIDNIEKLYIAIKYGFVPEDIVLHHIGKNYIIKWLSELLGAKMLAQKLKDLKTIHEVIWILEEYLGIRRQ